jgi:AcrR family transcriptional regulator
MAVDDERGTVASVWARRHPGRAPRRPLTREAIVATAIRIADAEGLAAVSMRRIATELDARTMSLYHHVARKEDLFALMADAVASEVLVPEPLPASWREAISVIVRQERAAAARHPWVADLRTMQLEVGPHMLRHAEQSLAALAELRLSPRDAIEVSMAVDHYVLGHTMHERWNVFADADADGVATERTAAALGDSPVYAELSGGGELPFLTALLQEAGDAAAADTFEQGLAWLLDGIERDLGTRRQ